MFDGLVAELEEALLALPPECWAESEEDLYRYGRRNVSRLETLRRIRRREEGAS